MPQCEFSLSILLYQEDNLWIAHCLEFDIASQGKTINDAKESFERTFVGQVCLDLKDNKKPLEDVPKAPEYIWNKFHAGQNLGERRPIFIPRNTIASVRATAEQFRINS